MGEDEMVGLHKLEALIGEVVGRIFPLCQQLLKLITVHCQTSPDPVRGVQSASTGLT
jgi:hypothetical protein